MPQIRNALEFAPDDASTQCAVLTTVQGTDEWVAVRFDSLDGTTDIYVGYFGADQVIEHSLDANLNHSSTVLPISWGHVWAADDLDRDGFFDLVLQRGVSGVGILDIVSSQDWTTRGHFEYGGMLVYMHAETVDIDDDGRAEIYLTPNSVGGSARAVIIKFDTLTSAYFELANIPAPNGTSGESAVGDFDGDGRCEFITGNDIGYGVFEWKDTVLSFVVDINIPYGGFCARTCRPKPGGKLHVLAGYGYGEYRYQLFQSTGDDQFEVVHAFIRQTGFQGIHPSEAIDVDCDGLDEMVMLFPEVSEVWEWDVAVDSFTRGCVWGDSLGTITAWYSMDLDQDGSPEWGGVNHDYLFRSFPGTTCVGCQPPGCMCVCQSDPVCDGSSDVLDVISAVDVAFRGEPPLTDCASSCPYARTDFNCSGVTDIVDVILIVNVAFRGFDSNVTLCHPCG